MLQAEMSAQIFSVNPAAMEWLPGAQPTLTRLEEAYTSGRPALQYDPFVVSFFTKRYVPSSILSLAPTQNGVNLSTGRTHS